MIFTEGDLEINIPDAISGIKFDEVDKTQPNYHGLSSCMKAVDFIVELRDCYLFIEIKDPAHPSTPAQNLADFKVDVSNGTLCKSIVGKFRDSFIYRWAENKLDKPIYYLTIITLEDALLVPFQETVHRNLPYAPITARWERGLVKSCHVINLAAWNRNFPKWPANRISARAVAGV